MGFSKLATKYSIYINAILRPFSSAQSPDAVDRVDLIKKIKG